MAEKIKHALPPVGTEFIFDLPARRWGNGRREAEVVACRVKTNDGHNIEYEVTEVLSVSDPAPQYKPTKEGGISAFGWDFYMRSDRIHVIEA